MDKYQKQLRAVELEMRDLLGKARAITDRAMNEGRGLEEDERKEVDGHMKSVEVLKEKRAEVQAAIDTRERVENVGKAMLVEPGQGSGDNDGAPKAPSYRSIGEAFVKSDGYRALTERGLRGNWSTGAVEIEGKTLLSSGSSSGGDLIQPQVEAGILPKLFQPLGVMDLFAQGQTNSNSVEYLEETTATNAAAGVAEGGEKPESTLVFDRKTASVKKIATLLPVTDEMLEDVPAIESYINGRLSLFVRQEEETQVINGEGGDDLSGIVDNLPVGHTAVRSSISSPTNADHVYAGITKVRAAFLEPDAIIMHPTDWEAVRTLKDDNSNYMGGGPFGAPAQETLWGKPVVVSTVVTQGTAIVGAFKQGAQLFRRGGMSVEASNSHDTFFKYNKTAIRAEERLALAIYRPAAFAQVDLGSAGLLT